MIFGLPLPTDDDGDSDDDGDDDGDGDDGDDDDVMALKMLHDLANPKANRNYQRC